jgi:hypothetical protein
MKQLKRGGRVHDPAGVEHMKDGELAQSCPACPDPDTNLEAGWDQVPEKDA